jgi:hypothetical protein
MEPPSVAPLSSLSEPVLPVVAQTATNASLALKSGIVNQLRVAVATQTTSYDVLYEWTQQHRALNDMRTAVVTALADAAVTAETKQNLYKQLILEEARVIGVVVDRLDALATADATADKQAIVDRVRNDQDAMKDALESIATEEATALRAKLFGIRPSGGSSLRSGARQEPPPLDTDRPSGAAARAAAEGGSGGAGAGDVGTGSKRKLVPQVPNVFGLQAEIKSGPISFDD